MAAKYNDFNAGDFFNSHFDPQQRQRGGAKRYTVKDEFLNVETLTD